MAETQRSKLGLALAGGGFRASLFHLGVLYRMAELDLLRYVEILSTVSGGSIIGALYALVLKKHLEAAQDGKLSRDDYVRMVGEVHRALVRGIQRDLRTRLFMNPFALLLVMLTPCGLGRRMARLYERHIYNDIVAELVPHRPWWRRWFAPGRIALDDIQIQPGRRQLARGIEAYNRETTLAARLETRRWAAAHEPAPGEKPLKAAVTQLLLNATSLNSGARFWFSSAEIGDWFLGHFRRDESAAELMTRKRLLENIPEQNLRQAIRDAARTGNATLGGDTHGYQTLWFAAWWRGLPRIDPPPPDWQPLVGVPAFPGKLKTAELGHLRLAKIAAWYLRKGPGRQPPVTGGVAPEVLHHRFWEQVQSIDADLALDLRNAIAPQPALEDALFDFILELYYFRTAELASARIDGDWKRLSLGDAVGASACFPPVFPPFNILGFYDDWHVSRLGLTDGGVFDNVGLQALIDEYCDHLIISDTSGLLGTTERAATGRVGMMTRITGVLMEDVAWKQEDIVAERKRSGRLSRYVWFRICSPVLHAPMNPPPGPVLDPRALARIRTDLDVFGDVEIAALVDRGYAAAGEYLRKYLDASPYRNPFYWTGQPKPPIALGGVSQRRLDRIVQVASSRFVRALRLPALWAWFNTVLLAAALGYLLWKFPPAVAGAVRALRWFFVRSAFVLGSVLLWVVLRWIAGIIASKRTGAGRIAFLDKFLRGFSGNLLWWFGPAAPPALALAASIAAWIAFLGYHLPFRRATRV